jgi:hypothetical protein
LKQLSMNSSHFRKLHCNRSHSNNRLNGADIDAV